MQFIRLATVADLAAILDIYNHYVLTDTCTFQKDPDTLEARAAWLADHGPRHPATVLERDGEVLGFGALSVFRGRWGYRHTVENTVYVHRDWQRRGLGGSILADLLARAQALGHHAVIAGICGEKQGSIALHERHGFVPCGRLSEVGHKFDRWLDLVFMQHAVPSPEAP